MECAKCRKRIEAGDEATYMGQLVCLDCYTDALSPSKPCDPWAVHSAKSMSQDGYILTKRQKDILAVLKKENGIEPDELASYLGLEIKALQRELATLRHMEKARAAKQGDKKVICLW
jgi:recombinational DNA repair protein (RecF pathway)